jgi:glycosyltransferase involved in cell wall biosynthesis
MESVSIIIPTFNGGEIFKKCLDSITHQIFDGTVKLLIIDSGSTDDTVQLSENAGAEVLQIDNANFHHSRTRNYALKYTDTDFVVYTVQDAIPLTDKWLSNLLDSIKEDNVAGVTCKQVPHADADAYARFEVDYHNEYLGNKEIVMHIDSKIEYDSLDYNSALKKIRFDNVCAIYNRKILQQIPFPEVRFGEDIAWAKNVMLEGYRIKYDPNVKVEHSHNRSPQYRMNRALINTMLCSEITGKINRDLSFLVMDDIHRVLANINESKEMIAGEINLKSNKNNYTIFTIANKFEFIKKAIKNRFSYVKSRTNEEWISSCKKAYELHMRFVLNEIQNRYPKVSKDELYACLEQVSASLHGQFLGEVAASYTVIKGEVPDDISKFIEPYLEGV